MSHLKPTTADRIITIFSTIVGIKYSHEYLENNQLFLLLAMQAHPTPTTLLHFWKFQLYMCETLRYGNSDINCRVSIRSFTHQLQ